jgi:putative endonuclease
VGDDWERLAEKRLKNAGYRILERNFRVRPGEIDLVAEENGVICFVEVKGRHGDRFGLPAEAVTAEKQRRIFRAAEAWLARERRGAAQCRFDVVSIREMPDGPEVEILRDAFRGPPARRRRR